MRMRIPFREEHRLKSVLLAIQGAEATVQPACKAFEFSALTRSLADVKLGWLQAQKIRVKDWGLHPVIQEENLF
jgi:hypothetical protein